MSIYESVVWEIDSQADIYKKKKRHKQHDTSEIGYNRNRTDNYSEHDCKHI